MDRVNWVTSECFNAIRQIASADPSALEPHVVHQRLRGFLDGVLRRGSEAGFAQEDVREMAYAMAALADEVVMSRPGRLRDGWAAQPLQILYFQENTAGENFFRRLDAIRQDPRRADVLRVYFVCLLFGFRGRYQFQGDSFELSSLLESVRTQLGRALTMPEVLSPEGARPEERLDVVRRVPVVWLGAGTVVLAGLLYLGLQVSLGERRSQVLEDLSSGAAQASELGASDEAEASP